MNDPYKILGVEPTATDKEIKTAYKGLVRKYHPDRFQDEAMAEMANEKMTEINAAYDKIMDDRKNGRSGFTSYTAGGTSGGYRRYSRESYEQASGGGVSVDYYQIRNMIHAGRLAEADNMLDNVAQPNRVAEWYFLKGTICYQRGWLNEAYHYIAQATQMAPGNSEYSQALQQMNRQRGGFMSGGSRYNTGNSANDTCNCLSDLCVADCCCEMMGGDLIPCC